MMHFICLRVTTVLIHGEIKDAGKPAELSNERGSVVSCRGACQPWRRARVALLDRAEALPLAEAARYRN